MRFTDTLLRQVRDRVSIADYAGKRLTWHKQKSRPSAGDYWACCPFHQEKSPSFHVLDNKGLFKCFGCGEKGDVFTLAMKLEGLSFPEAVEKFAEIAGVQLPKDDYDNRGENDQRKRLYAVTASAAKLFSAALRSSGGAEARKYLQGRGFGPDEWERFSIGFAPDEWTWAIDKLKAEGFTVEEIVQAGVARQGEDDKRAIDTFRGRITFEITDTTGKIIGFGGRALAKDAKAKYINSPETPLYSKSRVLYRLKQARELLAKTKADGLVVGEGYLDVIAFERAGIAAVAPCGTALTEEQLQLLWRSGGAPVLCLDGDSAGQRAAERALDLALPQLAPGRTIRLAYAPKGEDPDDIYRRGGAEALAALVEAAVPASEALFEREKLRHGGVDTPEAQAAFQASLKESIGKITDRDTQRAFFSELMSRANALVRAKRPAFVPNQGGGGWQKKGLPAPPTGELKTHAVAHRPRPAAENFLRAAADTPEVLARYGDWIERLVIEDPDLETIRRALLSIADDHEEHGAIDRAALSLHLTRSGEERAAARVLRWKADEKPKGKRREGETPQPPLNPEEWLAWVARVIVAPAIREELAELRQAAADGDDTAFARFQALSREAREIEARARESKLDDVQEDDAGDLVA